MENLSAFPVGAIVTEKGLTMRDYFAAKAMQGICSHHDTWSYDKDRISVVAYEIADAMLVARSSSL